MTPRLEACYAASSQEEFVRMARVLEMSAAEHCPGWQRRILPITPTRRRSAVRMKPHEHNAENFDHWNTVIQDAPDGECILLLDADTAILRPLDDIWDRAFDLAYTVKRRPFPFNLGVLFVRVSPAIRTLFAAWFALILQRLADPDVSWRRQYGGINQASFGQLLEDGALADLQVAQLPCAEWNCEESGWPTFDPEVTRILHIKGLLRRTLFRRFPPTPETIKPLAYYRDLEARAMQTSTG